MEVLFCPDDHSSHLTAQMPFRERESDDFLFSLASEKHLRFNNSIAFGLVLKIGD